MIDLDKFYYLPMSKKEDPETKEEITKCIVTKYEDKTHIVTVNAVDKGYRTKMFYLEFFEWLIYRKYVNHISEQTI